MKKRNIKKIFKKHKKIIVGIFLAIIFLILLIGLYKVFFYSSNEKDIYGVRLRDREDYNISNKELDKIHTDILKMQTVKNVEVKIKGRLIKFFVEYETTTNKDKMKKVFNDSYNLIKEDVRSYYDVTFYSIVEKDNKKTYPLIGYKHKNDKAITWQEN